MDGGAWWAAVHGVRTERLHFHFSLSCTGEGNGNPLQGSCLENPRDGGAWWAAISGVAQSQTRLKQLSSSSCSMTISRSTQAASNDLISFFFMTESYSLESYSHYVTVWSLSLWYPLPSSNKRSQNYKEFFRIIKILENRTARHYTKHMPS